MNLGSYDSIFEGLLGQGNAISYPLNVPKNNVAKCLLYSMQLMPYMSYVPIDSLVRVLRKKIFLPELKITTWRSKS